MTLYEHADKVKNLARDAAWAAHAYSCHCVGGGLVNGEVSCSYLESKADLTKAMQELNKAYQKLITHRRIEGPKKKQSKT